LEVGIKLQDMAKIDHQGGRGTVERFFVERDSSWRDSLRGQTSPRREFSVERSALRRDSSRRDSLYGENSRGERGFM
jgi:hypothetical protein